VLPNCPPIPRITHQLKELLAELMMENRVLKKSVLSAASSSIDSPVCPLHSRSPIEFASSRPRRKCNRTDKSGRIVHTKSRAQTHGQRSSPNV
jgi:hypothetical protein